MKSNITTLLLLALASLASTAPFTNPLSPLIAKQPYVIYADGYWYYMYTSYWEIEIARWPTLDGLKTGGQKKTIFPKLENDRNFYNPRLYKIDDTCVVLAWWLTWQADISKLVALLQGDARS